MVSDDIVRGDTTAIALAARQAAAEVAAMNQVLQTNPHMDIEEDIDLGYLADPSNHNESLSFPESGEYNTVQVRIQYSAGNNTPISLFFAPLIGINSADLAVTAAATFSGDGTSGFRVTDQTGNSTLLPFVIKSSDWEAYINGNGQDRWAVDPETGAATLGQDGIREMSIFPDNDVVNALGEVIHIAPGIRDAAGVLLDIRVKDAINATRGKNMNADLQLHLAAASLATTKGGKAAQAVRFVNGSLASSKLGLNPTSILRQLGGEARIVPILGPRRMRDGLAGTATVSMKEMTDNSGFFWERYIGNPSGRFSAVEEGISFGLDRAKLIEVYDRAATSFMAKDITGTLGILRDAGLSTLQILNFTDSINARTAWAAYKAEVQRVHPQWSKERQMEWVAGKASDAIRETQNSSSVLDLSTIAVRTRGELESLFLLFQSDTIKAQNRVRRSFGARLRRPGRGAVDFSAEMVNSVWSVSVGVGANITTGMI
ncbi:hypothetical protein LCGC14_2535910, partial [marine sediment metagenome]